MKNKILYLLTIFTLLLAGLSFAGTYEKIDTQIISPGVTLDKITRYTSNGWMYIDLLKIDLTNEYSSLNIIGAENGVHNLSTTKNMAKYTNAVAALNGDYFAKRPNTTNCGHSISFWGSNGKIIQSSADENLNGNIMSSFVLNNDNSILYTYLKDEIHLYSPRTKNSIYVADINKYIPLEAPCGIFTSDWGDKSLGNSEGREMIELVVENDKIIEIRNNQDGVSIPKNGYVVSAWGNYGIQLLDNFKVGDSISYNVNINLDLSNLQFAVSGGTMLVTNGEIPKFSHIIYGKHEFSAIGTSKDNKTVYLLAVTNINGSTIGITQSELANLTKNLGMHNAMILDGGGSTTLVAKQLGENTIKSINIPDGNYLRPVINSIGIFNNSPKTELSNLILEFDNDYIFKNNYTDFSIKGYDSNYNYVEIDKSKVTLSFSNSNANFSNQKILGLKEGSIIVTAKYGNVKVSKKLNILGDAYSLDISPKSANISAGKTQTFTVIGTDKNGYSSKIDNSLITWSIDGNGSINKGIYTASQSGCSIVSGSINGVKSYVKIGVMSSQEQIFDDFETLNGIYDPYPITIGGNVMITSNISKTGNKSLKVSYDFNTDILIKGAYYDYNTPLKMPDNTSEISFWIYSPIASGNSVKSQYFDSNGNKKVVILYDKIDFSGWKLIKYPNPAEVKSIVSLYVAQADNTNPHASFVCFDTLTVKYYGFVNDNLVIPSNITKQDIYNKDITDSDFTISIIEEIQKTNTLFDKIKNNRLINSFNSNSDLVIFNKSNTSYLLNLTTKYISGNSYSKQDYKNCTVITIDVSKSGIKNTDFSELEKLIDDLNNTKQNTIIVLNNSLDNFTDSLEKELFLNMIVDKKNETGNNYWIVQKGKVTNNSNYKGIKLLTIGNSTIPSTDINGNIDNYKYINIYIDSNDIYYDIKTVF